ncbi:hypothetical protein ACH42_09355 [Endozoicomonas sp. (ex Bugula neritina AB1)]|nr:hypothetical protein ACH42_09355 [Endozoicomonas sp. (ex Bugula neritina AB1)]
MSDLSVETLSHGQQERLAFIEFRLLFLDELRRSDICEKFSIGPAGATRDIDLYRKLAPKNLHFNQKTKYYRLDKHFIPIFSHSIHRALNALLNGFGDGVYSLPPQINCTTPVSLNTPCIEILSSVTRAIKHKKIIRIKYLSKSSGWSNRDIAPFALVSNGNRWHTRAYDRKTAEFRDFVLLRITDSQTLKCSPLDEETVESDIQWNRWVELQLVPHPEQACAEAVALDCGIEDGILSVKLRAAVAGYFLRQWNVDCSREHRLKGHEYDLWLSNPLELYGVKNALIAPGYDLEELEK